MDVFLILLAIGWAVFSAVNKKKRKEAQEEARRQEAEAMGSAPVQQARPVAPPRPAASTFPVYGGEPAPVRTAQPKATPPRPAHAASGQARPNAQQPITTRLTNMTDTVRSHVVEASSISGHAHQETSLSGIKETCEPSAVRAQGAPAPRAVPATGFRWNQNAVLDGLVMSEVLGKPKALRRGR